MDLDRDSLLPFFSPRTVAVIGASTDPTRIGGRPLHAMQMSGFNGGLFPVNPRHAEVMGMRCYANVEAIAGPVDLALLALPAAQVPTAIEQCARKNVRAVSIFSSGFAELDLQAAGIQQQMTALARRAGMRVLGPNCMGTMNTAIGFIGTFTSTIAEAPRPGSISIASQSGAFAAHCLVLLRDRGVGVDLWAAVGNQADVQVGDCIEYMAASASTSVIVACVEGITDAPGFLRALAFARDAGKPVVLMKLGASSIGADAVKSHTAALAGSDRVFDAVLRQYGAYRAHGVDELIDLAYVLGGGKRVTSRAIGIASISGGFGILMADVAEKAALDLPPLAPDAQQRLRALVPFAGTRNPLDLTAQLINQPELLAPMMGELLTGIHDGSAVLFLGASGDIPAVFDRLAPGLEQLAAAHSDRVLALCLIASPATRARLQQWGYFVFEDPTRAIRALAALADWGPLAPCASPQLAALVEWPEAPLGTLADAPNERQAKMLLDAAGIPVVAGRIATTPAEAVDAARAVGYPVVLKILSPDILHKTDAGCVRLDLGDDSAVVRAYAEIVASVGRQPAARIDGVLVESMIRGGVELILGVQRDPLFGQVVIAGLGGIFVEVLRDTALRVAPFDVAEAHRMLRELRGFAIIEGLRGRSLDVDHLAATVSRLSHIAAAHRDTLESLDINPFVLRESGGVALDAVIVPRSSAGR